MLEQHFATTLQKPVALSYLLHLPPGYDSGSESWPLILFLHGTGERGSDVRRVADNGLPKRLLNWRECPFIVVSPQCPPDSLWTFQIDALDALLKDVIATYRVDTSRLYLTGLSLGATGVYHMAAAFPGRFAAIAPICGRGMGGSLMHHFKGVPVWIFHGAKDNVVPLAESERMAAAIRGAGGEVRLTVYPDATHDSWTAAHHEDALYAWFLSHRSR